MSLVDRRFCHAHVHHRLSAILFFACVSLAAAVSAQAGGLTRLQVHAAPGENTFSGWSEQAPFNRLHTVALELGDELEGTILSLSTTASPDTHRVSVQFETSMAISDEGPHIDLLDWKHCVSEWKFLPRMQGENHYRLPGPSEAEASCFPPVTAQEIEAAVLAALRDYSFEETRVQRWLALARGVSVPGEGPSYIGVSKVRLRIEQYADDEWVEVTSVEFTSPLGC